MFKLTPETLDENRLRRSVDRATYELGLALFSQGQVQVLEFSDLNALCLVKDKRSHRISVRIHKSMLIFQCSCPHGSRGLICEHDVAAWLALVQHMRQDVFPAWREQMGRVMDLVSAAPRSHRSIALYFLFFSLQDPSQVSAPYWKIRPYTLALKAVPKELLTEDGSPPPETSLVEYLQAHPALGIQFKSPYYMLDPQSCINCPPASVRLANLILERERLYYLTNYPLEEYLPLVINTGSPLYLGETRQPLLKQLEILSEQGEMRLQLDREPAGLHLRAALMVGDRRLDFKPGKVQIVLSSPTWLLAEDALFELANPIEPNLLASFWEAPEVFVPTRHETDFLNRYYLELARSIPLEGNAVIWEEIHATPTPRLYLSDHDGEMQAQLRFGYADSEVRYEAELPTVSVQRAPQPTKEGETVDLAPGDWALQRICRQPEAELAAYEMLSSASYGLKRAPQPAQPGLFRLRARTHPVDFLLHHIPRLGQHGFEIYGEEQLKTARVNRNTPTIAFNVSSGIDWFDVKALVNFGELEVSLKEIRRVMRKKERFIKLADGSIGEIPEEWFDKYKHLFALSELSEDENLRLSRHHLTLIEQALGTADHTQTDAAFEAQRARLRLLLEDGFPGITPRPLPQNFTGELRPYQKAGFDWLHFLHDFEFGGCLADDMGLGKTIQTLVFLQSLYKGLSRPEHASLLVVPRSLLINWQREAERFTPDLQVVEFFNTDRIKDVQSFEKADLVITTYGIMLRDIEFLHRYTFYYAILDESQAIKNPVSQTGRAARLILAKHRLVLTGTPIENSTVELWSQFAFLNPGLLGNIEYFREEFGAPIEKKADENVTQTLRRLVFPFILRRTKDQVAPELPPRTERILYCDMDPAQRKLYNRTRDYYRGMVLGMLETEGLNSSRMKILEGLLRLRQIANHPRLVEDKFKNTGSSESGKFELLIETLETLLSENHKALIFSQFVQMLRLVRTELDERKIPYAYLDGHTQNRQEQVDIFQSSPDLPFFLISLKAGGLGLNLTAADYVIHIDPWWNPAVEMQASDRTHRIGQDKPVFVFKLIARDSVEEKILTLQERKRNLVEQIITTEAAFFKNLTEEDVRVLFS